MLVVDREIEELLLHIKGLVFARALLEERGTHRGDLDEFTAELDRERERLALLARRAAGDLAA